MQRAAARQTVSGETSAMPQKEKKTEQVVRTISSYKTVSEILTTALWTPVAIFAVRLSFCAFSLNRDDVETVVNSDT